MPRFTMSLPEELYQKIARLASKQNDSMSSIINRLIELGIDHAIQDISLQKTEQHCQRLIIQMNALVKNMAAEMLKFSNDDFEKLRLAVDEKFGTLMAVGD